MYKWRYGMQPLEVALKCKDGINLIWSSGMYNVYMDGSGERWLRAASPQSAPLKS
jgi:hypothetical protein